MLNTIGLSRSGEKTISCLSLIFVIHIFFWNKYYKYVEKDDDLLLQRDETEMKSPRALH